MEDLYKPVLKTFKPLTSRLWFDNGEINDEEIDEFKNIDLPPEKDPKPRKTVITKPHKSK